MELIPLPGAGPPGGGGPGGGGGWWWRSVPTPGQGSSRNPSASPCTPPWPSWRGFLPWAAGVPGGGAEAQEQADGGEEGRARSPVGRLGHKAFSTGWPISPLPGCGRSLLPGRRGDFSPCGPGFWEVRAQGRASTRWFSGFAPTGKESRHRSGGGPLVPPGPGPGGLPSRRTSALQPLGGMAGGSRGVWKGLGGAQGP